MKSILKLAAGLLPLLLVAGMIYLAQFSQRSTTFAGPSFHGHSAADATVVSDALLQHLKSSGFRPTTDAGLTGGVSMADSVKQLFVKDSGRNRQTFVILETHEKTVQTEMKWQIFGTKGQSETVHRDACAFALDLSAWIRSRSESNALPESIRETNEQWLREQLAANAN